MPNTLKRMLLVATALLGPAAQVHIAAAQDATYPCLTNNGGDVEVDYGPGPHGNIVGGGRVMVSGGGDDMRFTHLDPAQVQPSGGLVPVLVGGGNDNRIAYVRPQDAGSAAVATAARTVAEQRSP